MNDKEKLISLLILADPNPYTCESESGSCELTTCTECRARSTADHLIANGVTVQEWISVNDRLPEQGEEAICIAADGDMMIGKYTEWGWMFPCYFEDLTHWMPIPEPPKGE